MEESSRIDLGPYHIFVAVLIHHFATRLHAAGCEEAITTLNQVSLLLCHEKHRLVRLSGRSFLFSLHQRSLSIRKPLQMPEWKKATRQLRDLLLRLIKGNGRIWQPEMRMLLDILDVRHASSIDNTCLCNSQKMLLT